MKKIALSCLIFTLLASHLFAQNIRPKATYEASEILVRLKPQHKIEQLTQRHQNKRGKNINLAIKKVISKELGMYLLSFENKAASTEQMLTTLHNSPEVFQVQKNHHITYRSTTPNDPQFNQQWQYINTGAGGGTAGADIDMDLAWDITTGGTTPDNDEIVVCVIDDGIDADHPDLGNNRWVNTGETPGDGIDNDNNGYIDDYNGWNADGNNNTIGDLGHGTPVAGIIGAKGNNGVGVSGVNWNVKLMIVEGGGDEAQALAAYAYPHKMRQMYNQSNGQTGAFVVATNASWGVDGGDPAGSPMWCDFYNDLGAEGILNAGATANANTNVDTDGDLPTGCSSDYMISVTNIDRNDTKVTHAGYGATTIDLGAFGEDTWTMASGGGYAPFGGTSGATPHVAGTIGLLYSVNCQSFIDLAKSNPGAAALAIKQYIMDGTDTNASLQGITVSGGRLNAFKAIQELQNACGSTACARPAGFTNSNVSDNAATLTWTGTGDSYNIRHRVTGTANWTSATSNTATYNLSNLTTCTAYEAQVQGVCGTDESSWTSSSTFTTTGCVNVGMTLTIIPDNYGSETTWTITSGGTTHYSGGPYMDDNTTAVVVPLSLSVGCYDFNIFDQFGDGICCAEGNGSYTITDADNQMVITGGEFTTQETKNFCAQTTSLPVELVHFSGTTEKDNIRLTWQTLTETASASFELWESHDGWDWSLLKKTVSRDASTTAKDYEILDVTVRKGENYYRLDQIEADGQLGQSKSIIVYHQGTNGAVSLYPNPVTAHEFYIKNKTDMERVQVYDLRGQLVWEQVIAAGMDLPVVQLPNALNGVYSVVLYSPSEVLTKKIVVVE